MTAKPVKLMLYRTRNQPNKCLSSKIDGTSSNSSKAGVNHNNHLCHSNRFLNSKHGGSKILNRCSKDGVNHLDHHNRQCSKDGVNRCNRSSSLNLPRSKGGINHRNRRNRHNRQCSKDGVNLCHQCNHHNRHRSRIGDSQDSNSNRHGLRMGMIRL